MRYFNYIFSKIFNKNTNQDHTVFAKHNMKTEIILLLLTLFNIDKLYLQIKH